MRGCVFLPEPSDKKKVSSQLKGQDWTVEPHGAAIKKTFFCCCSGAIVRDLKWPWNEVARWKRVHQSSAWVSHVHTVRFSHLQRAKIFVFMSTAQPLQRGNIQLLSAEIWGLQPRWNTWIMWPISIQSCAHTVYTVCVCVYLLRVYKPGGSHHNNSCCGATVHYWGLVTTSTVLGYSLIVSLCMSPPRCFSHSSNLLSQYM